MNGGREACDGGTGCAGMADASAGRGREGVGVGWNRGGAADPVDDGSVDDTGESQCAFGVVEMTLVFSLSY